MVLLGKDRPPSDIGTSNTVTLETLQRGDLHTAGQYGYETGWGAVGATSDSRDVVPKDTRYHHLPFVVIDEHATYHDVTWTQNVGSRAN